MRTFRGVAALAVTMVLAAAPGAVAQGPVSGAIKAFHFPVPTYDEDGNEADFTITAANAPPPAAVIVSGWWPDRKMLLVQLTSDGAEAVYIGFYSVAMTDQPQWDARMRATGELVCAPLARSGGYQRGNDPTHAITATKGFKNPC